MQRSSSPRQSVPIPVPHSVAAPPEKNDTQRFWFIAAGIVLLLLLLLLLLLFTFGAGQKSAGSGLPKAANAGTTQETSSTAEEESSAESQAAANGSEESQAIAEPAESKNTAEEESPEVEENAQQAPPAESEAAAIPHELSASEKLLQQISGEAGEDGYSQTENRENEQSGGGTLVKGDATVNFFGATGKGSKFVFVFDHSASMSGAPLAAVKRELIKALEPLKSNHSLNLIAYDDLYRLWQNKLMSVTPENKAEAIKFIESVFVRGGTEPLLPLLEAVSYKPDVVFFMTDGQFTQDLTNVLAQCKRNRVVINVVQFGNDTPQAVLQYLAKQTGGDFMLIRLQGLSDSL